MTSLLCPRPPRMRYPTVSDVPEVQAHYEKCRREGVTHLLADMFAHSQAPRGVSDCTFMVNTANGKQFEGQEHIGDWYRRTTEAHGGNVNGKKYISGLAAYPGDPEAWVTGRGDAQRLLEKRGWGSEGTVNVKTRQSLNPPKSGPAIAEKLVEKYAREIAAAHPNSHEIDMADLKEQVREKRGNRRKKKEATKATI